MIKNKKFNISHITNSGRAGIGVAINNIIDNSNQNLFAHEVILLENKDSNTYKDYNILKSKLKEIVNRNDIIHIHAAWNLILFVFRKTKETPIIISPHGAFHPKSLQKSKLKKLIAKYLYINQSHKNAKCIHALTEKEASFIREYGITQVPIAIIPNGIDINEKLELNNKFKNKLLNIANGRRVILSLSRLEESKGIDILIDAYSKYRNIKDDCVLYIVGYGSDEYLTHLKNKVKKLELEDDIFLLGKLEGEEKNTVYNIANLFILPSYNEGLSLTVLEAFRQNLPVITTTGTPFIDIIEKNCGWYIEPSIDGIFEALNEYNKFSDKELILMGQNGYNWVSNEFDIQKIILKYEQLYDWIVSGSQKPEFIYSK